MTRPRELCHHPAHVRIRTAEPFYKRKRKDAIALKLALIHDWLVGMRGGERCLEVLCQRFPDARLFTLLHRRGATCPAIERMDITTSALQRVPGVARFYRYLLPLMPRAIEALRIPRDTDLVVSFSHAVAKGIRPPPGVPHVCYCFTPMRYAWHLRHDYFAGPHWPRRTPGQSIVRRPVAAARDALLDRVRRWDRESASRVSNFVAISRTVARRIEECYGRTSTIIHPPVRTDYFTPIETPREDYYLCLSALVPYKRVDLAVSACRGLGRRLVVIGSGPERSKLEALGGPTTQFLGWQDDHVVRDHLRRCRALLFPGHEDFGIVPVEAQACGTPVVALARGGATETILPATESQSGTGVLFHEQTAECLALAMRWLEEHPSQLNRSLARRQAERFHTSVFEQRLVGYLDEVVSQSAQLR